MKNHSEYNAGRLEATRRATERARELGWVMDVGSLLLVIILTAAAADYIWGLSVPLRWLGFGVMGLVFTLGVMRLGRLLSHPQGLKQTALAMEAQRPELGCVVSTAAEYLSGEREPSHEYEPELVEALHKSAARRLLAVEIPCYRRILRPAGLLSLFCGAALLFVALSPGALTAMVRVLAPWSARTFTSVTVKPGNGEIPVGQDLKISAAFSGRPPKNPQLQWREQSGTNWQMLALTIATNKVYTGVVPNVRSPLLYRVSGSDITSPEYTMTTYIPPEMKALEIEVRLPAYVKAKPTVEHEPNLSILRASQLSFKLTASCPLATARFRFTNQPALLLKAGSSNLWNGSLKVTNELSYWVELADAAGHKGGNEKPYHITVLPDKPPKVEITEPGMDVRTEATNRVPLKITAADDFGVSNLRLVFRKVGGPEQSVVVDLPASAQKSVAATNFIDLTLLKLKEYELVAYYAEARDNNTLDGPGIGKSPVYFIEYTTKGEPLSQCNGNGQKINLLQIEKQIIAATSAIEERSETEKLPQIATIQRQAKSYAEIFKSAYILSVSPPEARTEFAAAIDSMGNAAQDLDGLNRAKALSDEDKALEHLYQVVRLLPELEKSMCHGGNCTKIVLEAIEKLKEAQKKERERELPKILAQTRALAAKQDKLNDIYRQAQAQEPPKQGGNTNSPSKTPKPGSSKPGQQLGANSCGSSPQPLKNDEKSPGGSTNAPTEPKLEALAIAGVSKEQKELSESAAALAEKLRELSGKDPRVGMELSQTMTEVSKAMANVNNPTWANSANTLHHLGGASGLAKVIQALEQLLAQDIKSTDTATEEYPKEYESLISDYLRNLSFTE